MRKMILLICLILSLLCGSAIAENDTPPAEILSWMAEESNLYTAQYEDYIQFTMPDGSRQAFLLTEGGWGRYGFERSIDGEWVNFSSGQAMEGHQATAFVRHQTTQLRPDGTPYPDELGFDILCEAEGTVLSYHYNGEYFSVCGWSDPERYHGSVMIRGTVLEYYPNGSTVPETTVDAGEDLGNWTWDFSRLPATPEEAKSRADILQSQIADAFPGYTLRNYTHSGLTTDASYSRIDNGLLYFKFVEFEPGQVVTGEEDVLPVPLSASLLKRLETEPFDSLISPYYGDSRFVVDDAIDRNQVPVSGKIITADVQSQAIVFLTEDEQKNRYVQVVTMNEQNEYVLSVQTPTLPTNTSMDLFHRGDGEIIFVWDAQRGMAGYRFHDDGQWYLEWCMMSTDQGTLNYSPLYFGVMLEGGWQSYNMDPLYLGTLKGFNLVDADLAALPDSREDILSALDPTGWAVVNNPNPADRLHLRTKPDRNSESLGKFYNGTPVKILSQQGAWSQVEIGLNGLTGWMMTEYLAMETDATKVMPAYPQLGYRTEFDGDKPAFTDKTQKQQIELMGHVRVVGVVDDELYILLTDLGEVGYVPQDWLWEGNG